MSDFRSAIGLVIFMKHFLPSDGLRKHKARMILSGKDFVLIGTVMSHMTNSQDAQQCFHTKVCTVIIN